MKKMQTTHASQFPMTMTVFDLLSTWMDDCSTKCCWLLTTFFYNYFSLHSWGLTKDTFFRQWPCTHVYIYCAERTNSPPITGGWAILGLFSTWMSDYLGRVTTLETAGVVCCSLLWCLKLMLLWLLCFAYTCFTAIYRVWNIPLSSLVECTGSQRLSSVGPAQYLDGWPPGVVGFQYFSSFARTLFTSEITM